MDMFYKLVSILTPWQSQWGTNDIEVGQKHVADGMSVRIHF